jgi:hypothetical protein
VGGDYFFEVIAVFLRNFYKADTHTNGGIVVLYTIEIRPDHLVPLIPTAEWLGGEMEMR